MINHILVRTIVYFFICYASYQVLAYTSPEPDLSAKGIALLARYADHKPSTEPEKVRVLPFLPEKSTQLAWINIEKVVDSDDVRDEVMLKARQLAGAVGADALVLIAEGQTLHTGPSRYPLHIFRAKAISLDESTQNEF